MKKILLCLIGLAYLNLGFAQTFNPEFLDGRVMFMLKGQPMPNLHQATQSNVNDFSLVVNLNDYPMLKATLEQYQVTLLERPSYFTGKKELANMFRVTFADYTRIDELVEALEKLNFVTFACKEPIYQTTFIPNDTNHSGSDKWYHTLVGSENAWNISLGRNAVKIAIIDNAVFANHLDLTAFKQFDVADNDNDATPPQDYNTDQGWSHGTHCAGLATADINNNRGIASLGGNAELIGVKCTPNSATSSNGIWYSYAGIQWACQNGAHVVSMSFGGPTNTPAIQTLINAYPNVVFLAAAGNDGNSTVQYPAGYNNVIGVGSVNSNDARSSFSNFNGTTTFVDIAAPGGYSNGGLLSTVYSTSGNSYARMGGTSMATPFAAGLAGLILSVNPNMTPAQVLNCLVSTGVNINQNIGPRINALAAVQCAQQGTTAGAPIANFFGLPTNIVEGDAVSFYDNSANGGNAITTWQWSFPGGTPATFSGQVPPAITYAAAGTYNVSLTVTNSQTNATSTRTGYINVGIAPYGEWLVQNSGFATAARGINYISIVDPNVVWATAYDGSAAGANVQQFTKTTNGGTTWTAGNINVGNSALGISMIHALDANTAWLAAYPTAAGQTGGIWKTTNGGTTWARQNTASFNNAASFTNVVYFWDANEGVCQGDPINGDFEIYRTTNGGTTWTLVPGANIPNPLNSNEFGYVRQIEVVGDTVWFTTSVGRIYRSANRGQNWSVFTSPVVDFGGAITNTSTANLSFGTGNNGLIINNTGQVYRTTNGGANWTQVTTTGSVFTNGLAYVPGTSIVFSTGAATGASGSSYSEDGGTTWNLIDTEQHLYVDFINPSVGFSGWFNTSATQNGMWKWNDLSSPLSPSFNANLRNICAGSSVNYTDLSSGGAINSWQWSFPGGTPSTSSAQNPTVTYASAGVFPVSLTVSDGNSQSSYTDSTYITASVLAPTPSVITGNASVCPFSTETYSVVNNPDVSYTWNFPSTWNATSNSTNTINVDFDNTPGTLSVTADNVCGSSTPRNLNITVSPAPTAGFSYVDNFGVVSFTNTSTNGTTYSWDFGDTNTSTSQNPSNTYTANGNYTVTLIVTNTCGDADTSTQVINVFISGTEDILDAYSNVRLFPNPTASSLTIDGLPAQIVDTENLRVVDMLGRTVMSQAITQSTVTLNTEALSAGVYMVILQDKAFKFVKK